MKSAIEIFSTLGKVFREGVPQKVVDAASSANPWFTQNDIKMAAEAIATTMLSHNNLAKWIDAYDIDGDFSQRLLIIMAGNIPLVGMFDLMCGVAAKKRVIVKPSHKDLILMNWVIDEIKKIEPDIPIFIYSENEPTPDYLIATGGDEAVKLFKREYRETKMLLRGSRHSIAIISEATSAEDLERLMVDIYSYSGLGCRNVSKIFIPAEYDISKLSNPSCEINDKAKSGYLRQRALLTMYGTKFHDNGSLCFLESDEFPRDMGAISISRYNSAAELNSWISDHNDELQCIVANRETIDDSRRVDFGRAQYPELTDYADGIDTMKFLI